MPTNRLDSAKIFLNALGESLHERLDGMSDEELRDNPRVQGIAPEGK